MQLSRLLARLSPDERAELLKRRGIRPLQARDDAELAGLLAQSRSLAPVWVELNSFQLLLLRWLARRPSLEASWAELLAALGERVSAEQAEAALGDLRLWGLLDFDPQGGRGFVATYPAVASSLPWRGASLVEQLQFTNSEDIRKMSSAVGLKKPPTRKDERIQLLAATLSQPESCQAVVEGLPPQARELFEWLREQGGRVSAATMKKRLPERASYDYYDSFGYGGFGSPWHERPGRPSNPLAELVRRALVVGVTVYPGNWQAAAYAIPDEVELAYSGRSLFDTAPLQPPKLESAGAVNGAVPTPVYLLRDVAHLLGFVASGRCEWRQEGGPYKRSLTALGKALGRREEAYPQLLWDLAAAAGLVQGSGYGQPGRVDGPVDDSPGRLLAKLLAAWAEGAGAGATPGDAARAHLVRARLLSLLSIFPTDTWVLTDSLEGLLRFLWPVVFAPELQAGTEPRADWLSLRYLLLGHGATADGREAVMLPAAHQALLGPEPDARLEALPPWEDGWVIQPDRTVVAPPNARPQALIDLWKVARLEQNQGAAVFRISAESVAGALNRGVAPAEVRALLERRSRTPLPATVERLIDDQAARYGRIRVGDVAAYVRTDEPALLAELLGNRKLRDLGLRELAPGVAGVVGRDAAGVVDALRKAGYLPLLDGPPAQPGAGLAGTPGASPVPLRPVGQTRPPQADLLRRAMRDDRSVLVTVSEAGRTTRRTIVPEGVDDLMVYAFDEEADEHLEIPLTSIREAVLDHDIDEEDQW